MLADAACDHECYDVTIAQAEAARLPYVVTHDLRGETLVLVEVGCG